MIIYYLGSFLLAIISAKEIRTPLQIELLLHYNLGWSTWTEWSKCRPVKCGRAKSTRIRLCRSKNDLNCPGKDVEKLNCPGKTLPSCDCYEFKPDKASYLGRISKTVSGRICQPWSFQYPHRHNKKPEKFPSSGLDQNYCRNPGDTKDFGRPWCYTSDPFVEWEYCNVTKCESEEIKDETSQTSPDFLRNLITLIEARRNLCKHPCVNGICEKGVCECNIGFEGPDCGRCTCMNLANAKSCLPTGFCSCKSGWSGNNCDIKTCAVDCGPNGICQESEESLLGARSFSFTPAASFAVKNQIKLEKSNCGTTENENHVNCQHENRLRHIDALPSWCTIQKCPPNLPMLCEGNKCAQDCTWLGGNISICPHQVDFKENFKASVSTWNQVFKSSTTNFSNRSKRSLMRLENSSSNIGFTCKCLNGYTGETCLIPPIPSKCPKCGPNQYCNTKSRRAQCSCLSGWMRPTGGRKCSLPDSRQVAPCEWNSANWARPDSNYLQCNFINQKVLTTNILQSVVPPGNTRSLGIVLGTGHYIRKQDLMGMLDQLKTSLEKLYFKNVNFSSGEKITSIPQMEKLKSVILVNSAINVELLELSLNQQNRNATCRRVPGVLDTVQILCE